MKWMSRKAIANRENAQKSTGPRTEEGKAKVAQNRTKHGLTGSFQLLPTENVAQFEELLNQFMIDEKPVGIAEVELVKTMVQHLWMTRRADCFMNACFLVQQSPDQADHNECQIDVRPELERYLRYQAHHQRSYQRASNELLQRRKERLKAAFGFESQKQAEAEEHRRERRQEQHEERHKTAVAIAEKRLQREEIHLGTALAAAANELNALESPQKAKIAA
jgi:hypothetical protein